MLISALWRGYHLIGKMYNSRRIQKLAKTVLGNRCQPAKVSREEKQDGSNNPIDTQDAQCKSPCEHRRKMERLCWVSTDTPATLEDFVASNAVEAKTFCQDYEALSLRKYRKAGFIHTASFDFTRKLAHNIMIWMKRWFIDHWRHPKTLQRIHRCCNSRGLKRLRETSWLGKVCFEGKKVVGIRINPLYPMITHVTTACKALFQQYEIVVLLDKT